MREQLAKRLELAQAREKAVDQRAVEFNSGRASALQDALKLIDKAIQAEQAARIKEAAQGRARPQVQKTGTGHGMKELPPIDGAVVVILPGKGGAGESESD